VFACYDRYRRLVAFSLFFEWEEVLYARSFGIDYDHTENSSCAYFNLLFYEPIKYAVEHDLIGIHFGPATPAKAARGAQIRPLWSLIIGADPDSLPDGGRVVAWNQRQLAAWQKVYRDFAVQPGGEPAR
jgi:predicted N-acyltransferase